MKKVTFSSCTREEHKRLMKKTKKKVCWSVFCRFRPCTCMCKHAFAGRNTQQWQDLFNCSSKNFCSKDFLSNRSWKGNTSKSLIGARRVLVARISILQWELKVDFKVLKIIVCPNWSSQSSMFKLKFLKNLSEARTPMFAKSCSGFGQQGLLCLNWTLEGLAVRIIAAIHGCGYQNA